MRVPSTLLHGRVRTSTVGLVLLLVALLVLYVQVRPPPGSRVGLDGSVVTPEPTRVSRTTSLPVRPTP